MLVRAHRSRVDEGPMSDASHAHRPDLARCAWVSGVLAGATMLGGCTALAGWWLDVPVLTTWGGRISI